MENKVYILLTDTGSFLTKLIKLYTKKPYNHASISFDSELNEVYSFGRKMMENPLYGGFVRENVKQGLFKQANCAIYSITVTQDQKEKMKSYINEMEKQQDTYRYNFLGLLGFLINRPIVRKNAFFCSQFVATILQNAEVLNFKKPIALIAPHDLIEASHLNLEYEGNLKDYVNEMKDIEIDSLAII